MSKIGYARIGTGIPEEVLQIKSLENMGCERIFIDRQTQKGTEYEQFNAMCEYICAGDIVIVAEYSCLAGSIKKLISVIDELKSKNIGIISIKEGFDTDTQQGRLILDVFESLLDFERNIILKKQHDGIAAAQREGKYHGRKPLPFDEENFRRECIKWANGCQTAVKTMCKLNMKPNRFYKKVKELGISKTGAVV